MCTLEINRHEWHPLSTLYRTMSRDSDPMETQNKTINEAAKLTKQGYMRITDLADELGRSNALELIQKVTSNDASKLLDNQAQYSCFPNATGGIVDDLIVYRINNEKWLLVVNASNIQKDWDWINSQNEIGAELKNISEDYSLLAIQGPKAVQAMQSLTSIDLSAIKFYHFQIADFAGIENIIISATGYTGSGGFEIYCKNNDAKQIWEEVIKAGSGP